MSETLFFKDKAAAFAWYVDQGGHRGKSSFYQHISAEGKKVSRFAVSELLRAERHKGEEAGGSQRSEELAHLEVEEKRERVKKLQLENRREGAKWIRRVDADQRLAALVGHIYEAVRHRIQLDSSETALLVGIDPGRAPELEVAMESLLDRAFNEISSQRLVEVIFEEDQGDEE